MNAGLRDAHLIWQARNERTGGDRAYLAYGVIMVAIVAVAPLARALWLSATSAEGVALLSSVAAPASTSLFVVALWTAALLIGRDRGPALLSLFPLYVFGTTDLKRSTVFRGPLLRNGALLTASTTAVAAFVAAALASRGLIDPHAIIGCAAAGLCVGLIATVAWLVGQVLPAGSVVIALGLALCGVVAVTGFSVALTNLVALAAIATVLVALIPTLLNRLSLATLTSQAARWESATGFAAGMDFAAAVSTYRGKPRVGRHLRAVRPGRSLAAVFVKRDTVGAMRTPGRLIIGICAIAGAGVLMTLAFAPAAPTVLLGAAAGLVLFAGLGPLTDGLRHAASVAADLPLYGVSDETLLGLHALFPVAVMVVVLVLTVVVCAVVLGSAASGYALWAPLAASLVLGLIALATRVSTALKGMLPPELLTPMPTPAGDMSIVIQLAWAVDGVLVVALAGASAALILQAPALLAVVAFTVLGLAVRRWRSRG